MGMRIQVTPSELRDAARQFLNAAESLTRELATVKQQVASLAPDWQDEAAMRFRNSMPTHEQKVQKAITTFRETGNKLNQAANEYEAMSKAAASKIRV